MIVTFYIYWIITKFTAVQYNILKVIYMTKDFSRLLYRQQLYLNCAAILMNKIYREYEHYIDYNTLDTIYNSYGDYRYINDCCYVFFDTLCNKIYRQLSEKSDVIYLTLSPFHSKNVISGILVKTNNTVLCNVDNSPLCKANKLYTTEINANFNKKLQIIADLIEKSNKIQQE